jgi:prepilin-type processing-associated H-X9-DG protein
MQVISAYLKVPEAPASVAGTPATGRARPAYGYPLLCPATTGNPWNWDAYSGCGGFGGYPTDYALSQYVVGGYFSHGPYRIQQIPQPSFTALFADSETNDGWVGFYYSHISPRHKNHTRANIVCVDGHVEAFRVPWPTDLSYYNPSSSELGYIHPSSLDYGPPYNSYAGPGFKVYAMPPGIPWL